jgi:hypothetical protein
MRLQNHTVSFLERDLVVQLARTHHSCWGRYETKGKFIEAEVVKPIDLFSTNIMKEISLNLLSAQVVTRREP